MKDTGKEGVMLIINGNISDDEKILLDNGFFFGMGLFETILVKNAYPLFLDLHLERLNNGLKRLGIQKSISESEII